ncbi:MAG: hypothetical protein F6K48_03265 [Okeania sp. SIO3H1]|nr:hypothetical protein [Okeania sp. SIO3H1]
MARAGSRIVVLTLTPALNQIEAVQVDENGNYRKPYIWVLEEVKARRFWQWLLKPTSGYFIP